MGFFKNFEKVLMEDANSNDIAFLLEGYTPEAIVSLRSPLGEGINEDLIEVKPLTEEKLKTMMKAASTNDIQTKNTRI